MTAPRSRGRDRMTAVGANGFAISPPITSDAPTDTTARPTIRPGPGKARASHHLERFVRPGVTGKSRVTTQARRRMMTAKLLERMTQLFADGPDPRQPLLEPTAEK